MKTVLFTGGGGAGTEALDRLLSDRYIVHFADADDQAKPPSFSADRWHVIPPASAPHGLVNTAFVPALTALCERLGVDVLVPGCDEELRPIAMRRGEFPCDVLLPSFDFVATHLDKLASTRHLERCGIPVPETRRLVPRKGQTDWPLMPCVLKPREGRGSRDVALVSFPAQGEAHITASGRAAIDYITQERLVGQEYTVTVVADQAMRLCAIVPVHVALKRGITLRGETDAHPGVIAACRRIHAADPFSGCVNIQLFASGDDIRPFEINPRVSTTTCLAIAAGVNIIEPATGEPWLNGLRMHRSWRTEFACAS